MKAMANFFSLTVIREILPSLATAIAQGNIDPCTMEAFNVFPSTVNHVSTANIKKICGPFSGQEAFTQASKDSSVFAISSSKSRKETTGKLIFRYPLMPHLFSSAC